MTDDPNGLNPAGFTVRYEGQQREIITECCVVNPLLDPDYLEGRTSFPDNPDHSRQYKALWDTGASCSAVNFRVVQELGLPPVGLTSVAGVTGSEVVYTYHLVIRSPRRVFHFLEFVPAIEMKDEVIIGMDVIASGDFAFCEGNLFSYCYPSFHNPVEFGKKIEAHVAQHYPDQH